MELPNVNTEELIRELKRRGEEEKLEVVTSAGVIRAYKSTDPGQPGICVMLQPAGAENEIDLSYVSVYEDPQHVTKDGERPVDVSIMTYGNAHSEDYISKVLIRREDVMEACEISVTWDDLYKLAEDTGCGDPRLKAKDNARGSVADLAEELGLDNPEEAEVPEDVIEDICLRYKVLFDLNGHIVSYSGMVA